MLAEGSAGGCLALAGPLLDVFSPEQVPDLWGWWDETSIVSSGGSVSQWNDRSGNERNFTTFGSPAVISISGKPAINLDGVSNHLAGNEKMPSDVSFFIVFRQDSRSFRNWILHSGDAWTLEAGNWSIGSRIYVDAGEDCDGRSTTLPTLGELLIAHGSVSDGTGNASFKGSTTDYSISDSYLPPVASPVSNVGIGSRPQSSDYWLDGAVCELILFSPAVSAENKAQIASYLASKWDPVDADALAFLDAAAISDPALRGAVDRLTKSLKLAGIWSKLICAYPFVGGNASAHALNLKDPRNLNAAYRIVWVGSVTHDANGVTGAGGRGVTNFKDNTISTGFYSVGMYQRNDLGTPSNTSAGAQALISRFYLRFEGSDYSTLQRSQEPPTGIISPQTGWFALSRGGANQYEYYRGTSIRTPAGGFVAPTGKTWNLFNNDLDAGESSEPSTANLSWFHAGQPMSAVENEALRDIVAAFQTDLGRNV